jgi:predicted component of type VI protein secretion system
MPTHEGLTLVIAGWPYAQFQDYKKDIEGNYLTTVELAPAFARRLRRARREARFVGMAVPNYFRKPYGPRKLPRQGHDSEVDSAGV